MRAKSITANNIDVNNINFQVIVQQSPISTQIFDKNGNTILVNKAWEKRWKIPANKIIGNYNVLQDKQLVEKKIMPLIKKAFHGENVTIPEIKYESAKTVPGLTNVPFRWTKAIMYPIKDKNGKVTEVVLQHEDVTEQRLIEDALRESEAKFRRLFDANISGFFVSKLNGEFIEANDKFLSMIGYTRKELKEGKIHRDKLTPSEYTYLSINAVQQLLKKGESVTYEKEYIRKNGKRIPVLIAVARIGDTDTCVGFVVDISQRKQVEEALKRREAELSHARDESEHQRRLYEAITGSTPDLIYIFDLNAKFTYANPALLEMWGRKWDESKGKSLLEVGYEPWHAKMHEKEIQHIIKTKETVRGEISFPHAKLGKRIYDYIFVPVLDAKGKVVAIAGTTRDITEIKELERQKDEFLGIASHELKTPVTSIKAYGQVLQRVFEKEGNFKAASQLAKMDAQVNKLTSLISDLLDVTKIQSGRLIMQKDYYDFNVLVNEIVDELQLTTDRHKIIKELDKTKQVHGDRERIGQVLTNLISNAIKYSPYADKIIVTTKTENNTITLCVQDFGVGIPKDKQDKVFEQFFRVSGEKQHIFPGLGLGLYISSEIIKRQGGKIWMNSADREGSTFCFKLPAKQKQEKS